MSLYVGFLMSCRVKLTFIKLPTGVLRSFWDSTHPLFGKNKVICQHLSLEKTQGTSGQAIDLILPSILFLYKNQAYPGHLIRMCSVI